MAQKGRIRLRKLPALHGAKASNVGSLRLVEFELPARDPEEMGNEELISLLNHLNEVMPPVVAEIAHGGRHWTRAECVMYKPQVDQLADYIVRLFLVLRERFPGGGASRKMVGLPEWRECRMVGVLERRQCCTLAGSYLVNSRCAPPRRVLS